MKFIDLLSHYRDSLLGTTVSTPWRAQLIMILSLTPAVMILEVISRLIRGLWIAFGGKPSFRAENRKNATATFAVSLD